MNFLLDTNVVSEIRKGERANRNLRAWFDQTPAQAMFLSVLVIGELRTGVERCRRRDAATARVLEVWLTTIERDYADRILEIDLATADLWGHLNSGSPLSSIDSLLAATALRHAMVLVTRNTRDVSSTGVVHLNPFLV